MVNGEVFLRCSGRPEPLKDETLVIPVETPILFPGSDAAAAAEDGPAPAFNHSCVARGVSRPNPAGQLIVDYLLESDSQRQLTAWIRAGAAAHP